MHKVYSISEISRLFSGIASSYGIDRAYLFGSYARGTASPDSDIDICIERGRVRTLLQLSGMIVDAQQMFGTRIDIVTADALQCEFEKRIRRDFITIYG